MQHEPCSVIDERYQIHLLLLAVWPDRQVWPVLDIGMPQLVATPLLESAGGHP